MDVPAAVTAVRSRCTFPPAGTPVTCGVSGGADSLALLVLAVDAGLAVGAVHVDHGLRPGSDREADVVAAVASRFGAGFRSVRVEVGIGPDLEARARRARHAALPTGTLLGHTADDQAETVVLALLRGAGLDGVAAMGRDRHPILSLRRVETEAVCDAYGIEPVADASNDDRRFRRNRVRHEVLPLLDEVAERDVAALLARTARVAVDDVALLDDLATAIDPTDARALCDAPPPLARRAIRNWLRGLDPECHPPDLASVDRVMSVARGDVVATQIVGGLEIRRTDRRLRAVRQPDCG